MTTINNNWITLVAQRNGVTVQRKFAGLETSISEKDQVEYCFVLYWERELYPNNEVIKTVRKKYSLENLAYTEIEEGGVTYKMEPLAVLSGFIQSLGYPGIINPARETLAGETALPINSPDGYQLHLNTREKTVL